MRKWVFAIYLYVINLKGVSCMKLHRDLKVMQKIAWFMMHRLRNAWGESGLEQFIDPVEIDETYIGSKRKNMPNSKRKTLTGCGSVGKSAVIGAKDRDTNQVSARIVQSTNKDTLQGFVEGVTNPDAQVYTDDAAANVGMNRKYE